MNDQGELEKVYLAVQKEYSLNPNDADLKRFKKLLAASEIEHFKKDKYIEGLEKLVDDLKKNVTRIEAVLAEVKK